MFADELVRDLGRRGEASLTTRMRKRGIRCGPSLMRRVVILM
ncbi:hypothetical protein RISK_003140 [Rhodopirellula islandica]|uniref:Uncharacterized protein n=1 Tax=Rhodopirellula islandica TaxID=595434 RepID=A0A0J1BE46_RHOIS|nr:hypothetical protein RISK_003140 [Rhodopirellula islandica]